MQYTVMKTMEEYLQGLGFNRNKQNWKGILSILHRIKTGDIQNDIDWESFSIEAKRDAKILLSEIKNNYPSLLQPDTEEIEAEYEEEIGIAKKHAQNNPHSVIAIPPVEVVGIVGERGSGKTALLYVLAECWKKQKRMGVYFFNDPNPGRLLRLGYKELRNFEDIEQDNIRDCILLIDEPDVILPLVNGRTILSFVTFLTLCRQRNITVILATANSRYFNKQVESLIDLWCVKDLDYRLCKQGGVVKEIIKGYCLFDPTGFKMSVSEFIGYCRKLNINEKFHFEPVPFFTDEYSKGYTTVSKPLIQSFDRKF